MHNMKSKSKCVKKMTKSIGWKKQVLDILLVESLQIPLNDHFIIKLIRRGCDVNKPGRHGATPLHWAVRRPSITVAHQLIKSGADVDALDNHHDTPLHCAVKCSNSDAASLLLCLGADPNIPNCEKNAPLMTALIRNDQKISGELLGFCGDLSWTNIYGESALELAMCTSSPLLPEMIKQGAESGEYEGLIRFSLKLRSSEVFEYVWSTIDSSKALLHWSAEPFLLTFLQECRFPTSQLITCLVSILSCRLVADLVESCRNFDDHRLIFSALAMFARKNVEKKYRLSIIYTLMSLGARADITDIIFVVETYGFGHELEALMYAGHGLEDDVIIRKTFPLPACILAFEETTEREFIFKLLKNHCSLAYHVQYVLEALGYFSVPSQVKKQLLRISRKWHEKGAHLRVCQKLAKVPEVPSLLELSRNRARKFVIDAFEVEKPYQFHDAVRSLLLPERLKDVLRFKVPIH